VSIIVPGDETDSTGWWMVDMAYRATSVEHVNTTDETKNANENYALAA